MALLDYQIKAAKIAKKHGDIVGFKWAISNTMGQFNYYRDSESSIDSVHHYADQMLEFANKENSIELEARAYLNLGWFYRYSPSHQDITEANYYFKKAYKLSESLSISTQLDCLAGLYRIAYDKENYYDQVEYMEKSQVLSSRIKDNISLVKTLLLLS